MQNYLALETGATGFYVDMQTDTDDCETNGEKHSRICPRNVADLRPSEWSAGESNSLPKKRVSAVELRPSHSADVCCYRVISRPL